MDIAVIGGGASGVFAARILKAEGHRPFIIEKGKSVGGRLATRRIGEGKADHGAQFFTVRRPEMQRYVDTWIREGIASVWFGEEHPRYMSPFGMNQLIKHAAEELDVILRERIIRLETDGEKVFLASEDGELYVADAVIATPPVPQTLALLEQSALELPPETTAALAAFTFDPCIVALIELEEPQRFGPHGLQDSGLPEGIDKIAANDQKGISSTPVVTVHMTPEWSRSHYEHEDDDVLSRVMELVRPLLKQDVKTTQLKRWRFAQAAHTHPKPYMQLPDYPIYLAGDSFLREDDTSGKTRVESAVLSGISAARALLEKTK
ncbi:NAD(P)/FAD-dependent oxidoreductase [Alkalicoccus urumqiensis]|nr:FAD-dependent oxidoreductase [Alkalicoccus urumqiensis]